MYCRILGRSPEILVCTEFAGRVNNYWIHAQFFRVLPIIKKKVGVFKASMPYRLVLHDLVEVLDHAIGRGYFTILEIFGLESWTVSNYTLPLFKF